MVADVTDAADSADVADVSQNPYKSLIKMVSFQLPGNHPHKDMWEQTSLFWTTYSSTAYVGQANRRLAKFASAGQPHTTAATKRAALIIAYVTDIAASAETVRMAGVAQRQLNPFLVASEQEQALG